MTDTAQPTEHAILYTDAGFDLTPKGNVAGWGVHGYTFIPTDPKKGTGNPKAVPTDLGYLHETVQGTKVTPVEYLDHLGGSRDCQSNNEAELLAFYHALKWASEQPELKTLKLFTDSRMVSVGTNKHLSTWPDNKWLGRANKPVPYRARWEQVKVLWDGLKERLTTLTIEWVDRDGGYIGNVTADKLATRGKVLGHRKDDENVYRVNVAQGYWGTKNESPRILQAPRWYFATTDPSYKRPDGAVLYYVGQHGTKDKEDDLPGKKYTDNFFGVIRKKEPDPVLEVLRERAIEKDKFKAGKILIGYLDMIFSPKFYKEISDFGIRFLKDGSPNQDIYDAQDCSVLAELNPVGLGFRMIDQLKALTKALDQVICGDQFYRVTDITDLLYEMSDGKKPVRKLKASITQVVKYLDVNAEFNLEKASDEPKPFKDRIRLILGNDILSRNQLAAIAEELVSIHVVSWRESDLVGRYATLVTLANGDVGIWARIEANVYYDRRSIITA